MTNRFRIQLFVSAALLATPAFAQDTDIEPQEGDIVVTATRTQSLASKTPIALTAIGGEGLRDAGVSNPTQLADLVPNLSIDRGNGLQITIRGVTSRDGTEKGDPSAAFLLDGIYIARPQAQEVSFFDLERVEVLRGPQGTLFGRNSTAGVVHVISARPVDHFAASVDATYGNFDTVQATAMVNVPVNGQTFTFDSVGTTQYGGSFGETETRQNGYGIGRLASFSVDKDGVILGRYSNGRTAALGQVALANFRSVQDLESIGDNLWNETAGSGAASVGAPGSGMLGLLQASAVEESNVDLTAELVNMITAQRVYQANAQTIKTQDTILQTMVNLR